MCHGCICHVSHQVQPGVAAGALAVGDRVLRVNSVSVRDPAHGATLLRQSQGVVKV